MGCYFLMMNFDGTKLMQTPPMPSISTTTRRFPFMRLMTPSTPANGPEEITTDAPSLPRRSSTVRKVRWSSGAEAICMKSFI